MKITVGNRSTAVSLVMCLLGVGIILLGTACPPKPPVCTSDTDCAVGEVCNTATGQCEAGPTGCTSDEDCAEGEVCNTETGQCEVAPTGCTSDEDCQEDEFCDVQTGDCVVNENLYEVTKVDADYAERVHFAPSGHMNCAACHHSEPDATGKGCLTAGCHSDDPNVPNSFKDVAHDENESGDGCRMCHAADFANCAYCHPDLSD